MVLYERDNCITSNTKRLSRLTVMQIFSHTPSLTILCDGMHTPSLTTVCDRMTDWMFSYFVGCVVRYRSGTVNSNTVNSKFHLIRSYCEYLARILSFHV